MRIMCDTNVLLRAFLTPAGSAAELLKTIAAEHLLITSQFQLAELLDVLRRPKIRALHGRDEEGIRRVIAQVYKLAVVVPLPADVPAIVPGDPKDNPIVMTAVAGNAEVLCTLDKHLREATVAAFCSNNGMRVVRDAELLAELRARESE
jgi:putative PIN family toxin of toxin-antitoxin system